MRLAFADFPAGHVLRQDVDYLVMLQRQRWIEGLSAVDTGMIKAAGMTVEDLVDFRFARLRQTHAGRTLSTKPDRVLQRQRAYEAIRAAGSAGLSWGKTIAHVQDASLTKVGKREVEIDRKTIDRWLRALHEWGLVRLIPSSARSRGRPRKKE